MKSRPHLKPLVLRDKLFIPIPKNAHRSVTQAIQNNGGYKVCWNVVPDLPRIVLLREPMDRAHSTYRMFLNDRQQVEVSFDQFLRSLLSGKSCGQIEPTDIHIQPQWDSMGQRSPDITIKWDIPKLSETLGISIPHIGEGQPMALESIRPETQSLFDSYYQKDIELWKD